MPVRLKWEVDSIHLSSKNKLTHSGNGKGERQLLIDLIDNDLLTSHFQPIFSISSSSYFGFEALARIKDPSFTTIKSISDLFQMAINCEMITQIDFTCFYNAVSLAVQQGMNDNSSLLFVNLSPSTICDSTHCVQIANRFMKELELKNEKVVIEITEESFIKDSNNFKKIIDRYRKEGYKIAIDDFGSGFGGLKMLSIIEPDFVKIDRHFVSNIDKAIVKHNLVDSISIACNRLGIKVIAEGIERAEELEAISNMGIDLVQGFYLCHPQPNIECENDILKRFEKIKSDELLNMNDNSINAETKCIGDIAIAVEVISSNTPVKKVLSQLIDNPEIRCLPVVDGESIVGMIYRMRFIENQVVGKCGYGMHINYHKLISQVMERNFLIVEYNQPLEDVSQRVQKRRHEKLYDEIAVTKNGKYYGIVPINVLLDALTHKSLSLAKGANPLTGLPGNEAIQREIEQRIKNSAHFDVAYFDLNNFKPFNDFYGFAKGDYVIKTLAQILVDVTSKYKNRNIFLGHIGGDDFILICHPSISIDLCKDIINEFEKRQIDFHGEEDYKIGYYKSKNRKGEEETFGLLSLSIGIISTEVYKIGSFAELASISTEVKKAAKKESTNTGKSAIFRDRRLQG
ncbi:MAG: EAL and GGDEF domain-containing protein [Thermodesulfovibrionales bacterium]|nr:EAL and GGDEF domain-containing protein [Thermodesulfovibrionales bacterium]